MLSVVAKISDGVGECRVDWAVHRCLQSRRENWGKEMDGGILIIKS